MAFDADRELLADFLVEGGEIMEELGEQLVSLEQRPDDSDLLNSIFRSFHTIKGGAGFLGVQPMVDLCHAAEDVFDRLREGGLKAGQELMDDALQALDHVQAMFDALKAEQEPEPAPQDLVARLRAHVEGSGTAGAGSGPAEEATPQPAPEPAPQPTPSAPEPPSRDATDEDFEAMLSGGAPEPAGDEPSDSSGEIEESEFEQLLDNLHGEGGAPGREASQQAASPAGDGSGAGDDEEITEEEFDQLLDELHGEGGAPAVGGSADSGGAPDGGAASAGAGDEFITEDEFEKLLDNMHGTGGAPGKAPEEASPAAPAGDSGAAPDASRNASRNATHDPEGGESATAPAREPAPAAAAEPAASGEEEGPSQQNVEKPAARQKPEKANPAAAAVSAESTVRVDTRRLDSIMNLVGELVLIRNRLVTLGGERDGSGHEQTATAVNELDLVTSDLQGAVMQTRMQPVKKIFSRFPRVTRDLARELDKKIQLETEGEETDLDKNLVEALADPLVHLVRNAVDHGIESPEVRRQAGKDETGRVFLSAEQEGDQVLLTISDDGGGMDADKLRESAIKKGVISHDEAERMDDHEAYNLIFRPGFSTKQEISDISGRGVGMDVVKTRISQLNGTIEIDSELGRGSEIQIRVPLTLAILPTLMVVLDDSTFALPLSNVREVFYLEDKTVYRVDGRRVIRVRDRTLPLVYLQQWLTGESVTEDRQEGHVVVVEVAGQQAGVVVDDVIGREEVVIKPLGAFLQGMAGYAGATITGDGKIALILDVPILVRSHGGAEKRAAS